MSVISNDIYNFIYIAVIILGGIALTLTLILNAKERDKRNRSMMIFVAMIFVYMIIDFITYYYLGENVPEAVMFAMITISDIVFYLLMLAWAYMITVFTEAENVIKLRWIVAVTVVYQILSQVLSISLGRYSSYAIHVANGTGKIALQIMDISYDVIFIIIGIRCFFILIKNFEKSALRNLNVIMVMLFIGYIIWIAYWDYNIWYRNESNLLEVYAIDPLILMYVILNAGLIYYFFRKDPLKLTDSNTAPDDAIDMMVRRYNLSARERDVVELVNRGKSNPQIAESLSISENTVKRHMNNILKKTESQNRHELMFKLSNINSNKQNNKQIRKF